MLIQDYPDICAPVLTFDRFMGGIEPEDQCRVNLRFMYLMGHEAPYYRTFGYFTNEVLGDIIEEIFNDIIRIIFETELVDLQHLYIDGSRFESNANKYTWV